MNLGLAFANTSQSTPQISPTQSVEVIRKASDHQSLTGIPVRLRARCRVNRTPYALLSALFALTLGASRSCSNNRVAVLELPRLSSALQPQSVRPIRSTFSKRCSRLQQA